MHQQSDVIGIQARKSALAAEIFNYEFHQGRICVLQIPERKNSIGMSLKTSLDVRLIMLSVKQLPFISLLTSIWNASCLRNSLGCQGECHTCQSDLTIMKMEHKKSSQLMVMPDSLYHLTKLVTRLILEACDSKRKIQQLGKWSRLLSYMFTTLVRSLWCMHFSRRIIGCLLISIIGRIWLHVCQCLSILRWVWRYFMVSLGFCSQRCGCMKDYGGNVYEGFGNVAIKILGNLRV